MPAPEPTLREALVRAREELDEATDEIGEWAAYAGKYFQDKWDLAGVLKKHRASVARIDTVLAATAAETTSPVPAEPETGMVMVPQFATGEMYDAFRSVNCKNGKDGMEEFTSFTGDFGNWLACYCAMLAAAPPVPAEPETLGELQAELGRIQAAIARRVLGDPRECVTISATPEAISTFRTQGGG